MSDHITRHVNDDAPPVHLYGERNACSECGQWGIVRMTGNPDGKGRACWVVCTHCGHEEWRRQVVIGRPGD